MLEILSFFHDIRLAKMEKKLLGLKRKRMKESIKKGLK